MLTYKKATIDIIEKYEKQHPFIADIESVIFAVFDVIHSAYERGNKLLLCGNGGSNSDCEHIVGELGKKFLINRPLNESRRQSMLAQGEYGEILANGIHDALRAVNLSSHTSLLTASINDDSAELAYAQQLSVFGDDGDVLLAISTSGNSRNILLAAAAAKAMGITSVAFTGESGGKLAPLCDLAIKIPESSTPFIQEKQEAVYHLLCAMLEAEKWG